MVPALTPTWPGTHGRNIGIGGDQWNTHPEPWIILALNLRWPVGCGEAKAQLIIDTIRDSYVPAKILALFA